MEPAEHATLASRYGVRPAGSRRRRRVAIAALLLAGVAWAVWVTVHRTGSSVHAQVIGFRTEERAVVIDVEVQRPLDEAVVCTLRARGRDGAVVGTGSERFNGADPSRRSVRVVTSERPVSGEIVACSTARGG